jgi:SAM-dependent methyltransferase
MNSRSHAPRVRHTAIRPDMVLARLILTVLFYDSRLAKLIRRPMWSAFYNKTCREFLPQNLMAFLNLGYLASPGELGDGDRDDIADCVSERLHDRVVSGVNLAGKVVAEVGCGPGAGSAHLARAYSPALFIGIDFNQQMIAWCRRNHNLSNLTFLHGDALDLPVGSASLDAVINIESSHCYPSRSQFFEEVMRVLRPGGSFLFADIVLCLGSKQGPNAVSAHMEKAGMIIDDRVNITENVLMARNVVTNSVSFRSRIPDDISFMSRAIVEESLFLAGTNFYNLLASGRLRYVQWRASKPGRLAG